jgi:hypothetical protein
MPLLESQIDHHALAGTTDEDFEFGMRRLISGFEALLDEQEAKAGKRQPGAKRVAAAKPAAKVIAEPAPAPKTAPGSQPARGRRTRAPQAS